VCHGSGGPGWLPAQLLHRKTIAVRSTRRQMR
jgi:hypothetical protein